MNSKSILILTSALILITGCSYLPTASTPVSKLPNESCIASFDVFAFTIPNLLGPDQEKILPLTPWKVQTTLPETQDPRLIETETVRISAAGLEVWIKKSPPTYYFEGLDEPFLYFVFQPDTGRWRTISAQVEDSQAFVDSLFVDKNGAIWGRNVWAYDNLDTHYPVLSRFNEEKQRFEFEETVKEIPHGWLPNSSSTRYPSWDKVLLDEKGIFWIFVSQDAIYSYDPNIRIVVRHADLSQYKNIGTATFDQNGNIFFTQRLLSETLEPEGILEFNPATESIKALEISEETWLVPGNILVDESGRLWLDAFGFQEPNGIWITLNPRMRDFVKKIVQEDLWTEYYPPSIFMESSDGRLWFGIGRSREKPNFRTGIAWFNPETKEGCWFTSEGSNIVEDPQHRLWMVVDNNLYTYLLNNP